MRERGSDSEGERGREGRIVIWRETERDIYNILYGGGERDRERERRWESEEGDRESERPGDITDRDRQREKQHTISFKLSLRT